MQNEIAILRSLQTGVSAAVAACITPDLPIAYVDVKFNKPADRKWLEILHIPNNRMGDFLGTEKNYQGMLRLILHWPNDGAGPYRPMAVLGSITEYFTVGLDLSGTQIYAKPDYTGALTDGDEVLFPCSIRYRSYRRS